MTERHVDVGDEELFEEVDLFDTALIQGGCTNDVQPVAADENE